MAHNGHYVELGTAKLVLYFNVSISRDILSAFPPDCTNAGGSKI